MLQTRTAPSHVASKDKDVHTDKKGIYSDRWSHMQMTIRACSAHHPKLHLSIHPSIQIPRSTSVHMEMFPSWEGASQVAPPIVTHVCVCIWGWCSPAVTVCVRGAEWPPNTVIPLRSTPWWCRKSRASWLCVCRRSCRAVHFSVW